MTEVVVVCEGREVYRSKLPPGEYRMGRTPEAEIFIDHPTVSRLHAKLIVAETGSIVVDLGSGNGTFIDDHPIENQSRLCEGQTVQLGAALLRIRQTPDPEKLSQFAPYETGEVVARGGMGAILQAHQNSMGREVAMKVMLDEDDPRQLYRFMNEARITGMLEHPNIVPIHELGKDASGRVFYTMKFVRGETLAEVIKRLAALDTKTHSAYPLPHLLTIFQKICDAIAFAHSRGIIHRDLKPANIMLGDFGEVLVMDWGIAKDIGFGDALDGLAGTNSSPDGRTIDGAVIGSPAYMSPEQARGEVSSLDARSDIFALGAILYEILYLHQSVRGSTPIEVIAKVAAGNRRPIHAHPIPQRKSQRVPASLRAVCHKALALDPDRRYQKVEELQADIAAYQGGFATGAEAAGPITQLLLFVNRHRGVSVSVTIGIAALAIASVLFVTRVIDERNLAEEARMHAEHQQDIAENALTLVEPARQTALQERDNANAALAEAEAERQRANTERDRALTALAETEAIRNRATSALEEIQNASDTFMQLAEQFVRSGLRDEANQALEFATQSAPTNPIIRARRADILQASGRFPEAIREYRTALELGDNPQVAQNLAATERFLEISGNTEELPENVRAEMEALLSSQNRAIELILLNPPSVEDPTAAAADDPANPEAPAELPPDLAVVAARLKDFTDQSSWRPTRIGQAQDGGVRLDLSSLTIPNLSILRGTNVTDLDLDGAKISSLSGIDALPLKRLNLRRTGIGNLGALRGLQLEWLNCAYETQDLSPLRGMPLKHLDIDSTQVSNLSPIRDLPLEFLSIGRTRVDSLKELRGLPLKELHAKSQSIKDFSALTSLTSLQKLALPAHATGIDFAPLQNLQEVSHSRFPHSHWINGREFIELAALSDQAWKQWSRQLQQLKGNDLGPHRLSVSSPVGFDLDLRNSSVQDLTPLKDLPIHRLQIDTRENPIDISPLANNPILQHLNLVNANVPTLAPAIPGSKWISIGVNRNAQDVHLLKNHPTLQFVSYDVPLGQLEPTVTVTDFFHPRIPHDSDSPNPDGFDPISTSGFDDPVPGANGWAGINDRGWKSLPVWTSDPPAERGRGGGHITYFESDGETRIGYFQGPESLTGDQSALLGSALEFQLRHSGSLAQLRSDAPDVVLVSGTQRLVHQLPEPPTKVWKNFIVSFSEATDWRIMKPDGKKATEQDLENVLKNLDAIQIRAGFTREKFHHTDFDELKIWSPESSKTLLAKAAESTKAIAEATAWATDAEIISRNTADIVESLQTGATVIENQHWLPEYEDRKMVLLVAPRGGDSPAKVRIPLPDNLPKGSRIQVTARSSPVDPGVILRVNVDDDEIGEERLDETWKDFVFPIPRSAKDKTPIEVCICSDGWRYGEYGFIGSIAFLPPDSQAPSEQPD